MRCFNCGNTLPANSQFCHYCGADLTKTDWCAKCGNPLEQGTNFCPICGTARNEPNRFETEATSIESAPPTNNKKWPFALLACCLVAIIAVGGFFLYENTRVDLAEVADNVLYLEIYDNTNTVIGCASGFLVNDETTLVTNYHVIEDAYRIVAMTSDGQQKTEILSVISYDDLADLAVLKCASNPGVQPLTLADSDAVKQGDAVYAAGYPLGLANTLSDGIVSSRYIDSGMDVLQITAPISVGSSGGALLNGKGEVIGIICAYYEEAQNLNIAIAANELAYMLRYPGNEKTLQQLYSDKHPQPTLPPPYVRRTDCYVQIRTITLDSKQRAEWMLINWKYLGNCTEEAIIAAMDEYAPEQGGRLYTIAPRQLVEEVDKWCFDINRQPGDVDVIETVYGATVCYFSGVLEIEQPLAGVREVEKLVVGTSPDFPPFEYYDEDDAIIGIETDLMRAIAEEIECPIEFVDMRFDDLLPAIASGKINCIASGMTETREANSVANASVAWHVSTSSLGVLTETVIYVDDEYEELLKLINSAIENLYNNGTIDEIISRYDKQ